MEIIIKEEKENPFLKRKNLKLEVKHPNAATPSKKELLKELAEKFSVSEDQVVIDYILTKKGISNSVVKAKILAEKPKIEKKTEQKEVGKVETQANKTE
jgi:small subunit ribosomal protein S24e